MDAGLLAKLFGRNQEWQGPCVVILDAEAAIQTVGTDSIQGGGSKVYAPRTISGRVLADAICLLQDGSALVIVQHYKVRQPTGEDIVKQTLTVADPKHVIAIEFADSASAVLQMMGLAVPAMRSSGSHSGIISRPRPVS